MASEKPIHSLVIDAGPIIKNSPPVSTLLAQSEAIFTIPAVVAEIRDEVTRARVETTLLPFLTQRNPHPDTVKIVQDFARRTGDLAVLSNTDIQLIALARDLECERNGGDWRLRNAPGQKRTNGPPPAKPAPEAETTEAAPADDATEAVTSALSNAHICDEPSSLPSEDASVTESDSDNDGWITPSNIKKKQARDQMLSAETTEDTSKTLQAAIMTTDFAMQNVILQMNLNLLSPSLHRVRHLKTFVLRCHACFLTTKEMNKQFCPRCGKPSLTRVTCTTSQNGEFKLHLKKNIQWNNRGERYSLPKPASKSASGRITSGGGKDGWGAGLILAEDQKEYVRAVTQEKRQKQRDLMDEDYLPSILTGERNRSGGRPKVGAGRNINAAKKKR